MQQDIPIVLTNNIKAAAIKLFFKTYLTMRISYFNELDSYAEVHGLGNQKIITDVNLNPQIDSHYNNPIFGYSGSCLLMNTKQLLANCNQIPNNIIRAIIEKTMLIKISLLIKSSAELAACKAIKV